MVSYPNYTFPGQAFKALTSTQRSFFHQQLTTGERMCWTRELNLRTPERKAKNTTHCAKGPASFCREIYPKGLDGVDPDQTAFVINHWIILFFSP